MKKPRKPSKAPKRKPAARKPGKPGKRKTIMRHSREG
jgi:hypothetical protein